VRSDHVTSLPYHATFHVRPAFEDTPTAWLCVCRYTSDDVMVGVAETEAGALEDVRVQLNEAGFRTEAGSKLTGVGSTDRAECRDLLWSVKSRLLAHGQVIAEVGLGPSDSRAMRAVENFGGERD
jgi:hypothetical protein